MIWTLPFFLWITTFVRPFKLYFASLIDLVYAVIVYYARYIDAGWVPVKECLSVDVHHPVEHVYLFCRAESVLVVVTTHRQSFLLHLTYRDLCHIKDAIEFDMHSLSTLEGVPIQHARSIKYTPNYCPSELTLSQLGLPAHLADLHLATSPPSSSTVPYLFRAFTKSKSDRDLHRQVALRQARDGMSCFTRNGPS